LELAGSSNQPHASGTNKLLKAAEKLCFSCIGIKKTFNFEFVQLTVELCKNKTKENEGKCQIKYVSDTGNDNS
jgi:hypothetical protein